MVVIGAADTWLGCVKLRSADCQGVASGGQAGRSMAQSPEPVNLPARVVCEWT